MRALTPEAAALIRSGKTALRPGAADRARVLESLGRTLGDGALHDAASDGVVAASRFFSRWGKLLSGLSVIAVGSGVVVAPHLSEDAAARSAPAAGESSASIAVALLPEEERAPEAPRFERTSSVARPAERAPMRAAVDSLPEEVRLLSTAERQLNDGLGDEALTTLSEHERRFPRGALAEERVFAHVETLCALGRFADAATELARLAHAHPKSLHLESAKRFCGAAPGATP